MCIPFLIVYMYSICIPATVDDAKALSNNINEIRQDIEAVLKDLETEMMCILNGTSRPAFDLAKSKALLVDIEARYVEAKNINTKPKPTAIRGRGGKLRTVRGGSGKGVEGENSEVSGSGQMERLGATSEGAPEGKELESEEIPGPAVKPKVTTARTKPTKAPGTTNKGAAKGKELGEISKPATTRVRAKPTETPGPTSEGTVKGKELDNILKSTVKSKSTQARAKPTEPRAPIAKTKRGRGSEDDEHAPESNPTGKKTKMVHAGPKSDDTMGSDLTTDDSDLSSDEEHNMDPAPPPKDNESLTTGHAGALSSVTPPVAGVPGAVDDNDAAVTATTPTRGEHGDIEMLDTVAAPVTQQLQTTADLGSIHGSQHPIFAADNTADDGVANNIAGKETKGELDTDSDGEKQETTTDDAPDDTEEEASESDSNSNSDSDSDNENDNDNDNRDNDKDGDDDNDNSDPTLSGTGESTVSSDDDASDVRMQLADQADIDDLDKHAASHKTIVKKETKEEATNQSNQVKTKGVSGTSRRGKPSHECWGCLIKF